MSQFKLSVDQAGACCGRHRPRHLIGAALLASAAACVADPEASPPLAGSIGASAPPPPDDAGPPATPLLVEAEDGQQGDGVSVEMTGPDAYVTAVDTASDEPGGLDDPRVVSLDVTFPEAGDFQTYLRFLIGPGGADDDSFYINVAADGPPSWSLVNSIAGFTTADQDGHDPEAIVGAGGDNTPEVWKWVLLPGRRTVEEGELMQTLEFATREDGFQIDKFAFAIIGDGFTTGFTTVQLDAGQPGVVVF